MLRRKMLKQQKLALDAQLLLMLVQSVVVLALYVVRSLAQATIQHDDVACDVAKLIVCKLWHRLNIGAILHRCNGAVEAVEVAAHAHREYERNSDRYACHADDNEEDALIDEVDAAVVAQQREVVGDKSANERNDKNREQQIHATAIAENFRF